MTPAEAAPRTGRAASPQYVATAAALGLVVLVSRFVSAAHADFPSSLPPPFVNWQPLVGPEFLVVLALMLAALVALPWLLAQPRWAFLLCVVALTWVLAVTLAIQGGKPRTLVGCCATGGASAILTQAYDRPTDYLVNVEVVRRMGPLPFDRAYAYLERPVKGVLSLRAQTHPPGAILFLWALAGLTHDRVVAIALLTILVGALSAVPTYLIAKELHGERAARAATVLFASSPAVLLYTATSMDAVFMTVLAAAAAMLVRAPRSDAWAAAAGVGVAVALCFTWAATALVVVGAGVGLLSLRREPWTKVLRRGVVALGTLAVAVIAIRRFAGIDLWACLRSASRIQREYAAYRLRPYWYWVGGSIVAFLIAVGVGHTALLVGEARDRWRERRPGFEMVVWATLLVSAVFGMVRGETEHIWLFMVPLVAAAAAPMAEARLRAVAGAGFGQAALTEALFFTNW